MLWSLRDGVERSQVILCIVIAVTVTGGISARQTLRPQPPQSNETIPPLVEAIWSQDLERVKQLLADGADPDAKTTSGNNRPAWAWAIAARDDRATELLLSKVKTVNGATALLVAANRNDVSLARALFARGMPVDARHRGRDRAAHRSGEQSCRHAPSADRTRRKCEPRRRPQRHSADERRASWIDRVGQAPARGWR